MESRQSCTFVEPDGTRVNGYRWKNPDGSTGGWIAENAQVHPTAIVELGAIVAPGAEIPAHAVIRAGAIIASGATRGGET
jgi:UDP-3-O-[3-hydroxymyristoyl] glucosamine N-acyltransferase